MKIIGMLPVYNDEDIIAEVLEHLISEGLELVVLDNGSSDNSFELCKKFVGKGILKLIQFKTQVFVSDLIFRMLYDMALTYSPDWVLLNASDEIIESGIDNMNLREIIIKTDSEGYNLIQVDRFDFFITNNDDLHANSIKKRMPYYSYQGDFNYRAWKYFPGIRFLDAGGHYPVFPDGYPYKIWPKKFVLRHYSFRTKQQAELKMKYRIRGREKNIKDLALDGHEQKVLNQDFSKKFDHNLLYRYNEDGKWEYKIKFCPFADPNPPKKEALFTADGKLKEKPLSNLEYKLLLQHEKNKFLARNIRKFKKITKIKSE